jgi:hypothetical protein
MKKTLNILAVRIDGGTQPRASINLDAVSEYAEAITAGASLPPPTVFHDGADYWLADGFHRYHANKKIGAVSLECEVIEGTQRDAVLYSLSANQAHGLRRSNEDKRKAVMTLLNDAEWVKWSDNQIAKKCGVSPTFVGTVRSSLSTVDSEKSEDRTFTTKHGTQAAMSTGNIGKKSKKQPAATPPAAAPAPAPAPAAPSPTMTAPDGEDLTGALEESSEDLHKAVEMLTRMNESLMKDDHSKEILRLQNQIQTLEDSLSAEMTKNAQLQKLANGYGKWYADLRKATGLESRTEILEFCRSMKEQSA